MTERLFHAGVRGTLWFDRDVAVYVVTIIGHDDERIEERSYDRALSMWTETANRIASAPTTGD